MKSDDRGWEAHCCAGYKSDDRRDEESSSRSETKALSEIELKIIVLRDQLEKRRIETYNPGEVEVPSSEERQRFVPDLSSRRTALTTLETFYCEGNQDAEQVLWDAFEKNEAKEIRLGAAKILNCWSPRIFINEHKTLIALIAGLSSAATITYTLAQYFN